MTDQWQPGVVNGGGLSAVLEMPERLSVSASTQNYRAGIVAWARTRCGKPRVIIASGADTGDAAHQAVKALDEFTGFQLRQLLQASN
jgi:hypothetical protein